MAEPNVTHVYTTPGTYTARLTVTDNDMSAVSGTTGYLRVTLDMTL